MRHEEHHLRCRPGPPSNPIRFGLTSPTWTDPTGTYGVTLDTFDRATVINDPVNASNFVTTYRADGQPASIAAPNGNTTAFAFDTAGHLTSKNTTAPGPVNRALYAWTYNRAGQVLSEASTITGDTSNGTVIYGYDPLGRLTGSTLSSVTTAYGWDAVPNRTSVQVGAGSPLTTTYNNADRPTSDSAGGSYTSDDDGRLITRPNQQLVWDHLGRLTQVKDGVGTTLATYSYDPLDRLRLVDYGGSNRIRFRYVGLTTSAAQWIDDVTGTVTRSIGTGWSGERLLDWTGAGTNIRIYGENAHHDVTWLASSTGTVSQALRYDPWGTPRAAVPTNYTPFRFQGSWFDDTTSLSWVVSRWYAPALGRFVSEDSLLGDAIDPPSRHLYAYGQGEPVGRWDPDGTSWCPSRCTFAYLYKGATNKVWTHTLKNKLHARGVFRMADFIRTKWVDPKTPGTNGLKGDWRNYASGYNCLESRACFEIDFSHNRVTVTVQPSCERIGTSDTRYLCKNALDINAPWPLVNAISLTETGIGQVTLKWSLNQSITWGILPIDGRIELTPPGAKDWYGRSLPAKVRVVADGYPSLELWYKNVSYKPVYRDYEGTPIDLGPGMERNVTKGWPSW